MCRIGAGVEILAANPVAVEGETRMPYDNQFGVGKATATDHRGDGARVEEGTHASQRRFGGWAL